jgi:hypothetical protein
MKARALVLVVDIYGFTRLVKPEAILADPMAFLAAFRNIIRNRVGRDVFFDELDGGALVVRELTSKRGSEAVLNEFQSIAKELEADLKSLMAETGDRIKRPGALRLGWYIVRAILVWDDDKIRSAPCGQPVSTLGTLHICPSSPAAAA